jgi:UDP-glucose 4-epimerase
VRRQVVRADPAVLEVEYVHLGLGQVDGEQPRRPVARQPAEVPDARNPKRPSRRPQRAPGAARRRFRDSPAHAPDEARGVEVDPRGARDRPAEHGEQPEAREDRLTALAAEPAEDRGRGVDRHPRGKDPVQGAPVGRPARAPEEVEQSLPQTAERSLRRRRAHAPTIAHAPATLSSVRSLSDSTVLVIGGAGFIGSNIVDQLRDEPVAEIRILDNLVRGKHENIERAVADPRVRFIEGSIVDRTTLASAFDGVDYVFHLAALWLYECVHEPRAAIEVNIEGTWNVIEAALAAGVQRVVYSSSASVYGNAVFTPMTEEHPFANRTMYGATKIAGEQFFRAMKEQHDLDYVGLRYMNVYGPRMDDKGTYVSVIMKVLDKIDRGEQPVIFGDGSQSYDFVHVADVARANGLAMKSDATDANYNVGIGVGTSLNELVQLLLEITGSRLEPLYEPQTETFVTHRIGSTEAAERDFGFRAGIELREGLESVVEWRRALAGARA